MLFPSTRPRRIAPTTNDSQYDTATGYSSTSFTKWPRSQVKSGLYAARNAVSIMTPSSRHSQSGRQHHNYSNGSYTDLSTNKYAQRQNESIYSTISPQRAVVNYLLPLANGATNGTTHRSTRQQNWSSLGSLNSFGDSTTTPPSSQDHTGIGASNTGASGMSTTGQQRETLHSRFEFKQTLGKGTYGKVKLALDKRKNEQVAIKTIKKSRIENPHDLARIRREIDFMTSLNHPYIIKIKEVYESREKIILVMEYASGGELYDYLNRMKRIPESQARAIFRQIVSAVHFLHKNQIVHRDLKLENILIDHNGDIKLADFGLSNSWSPRRLLHTFCGSPLYASPEIVSGIPYYGPEVDCWSLGVLLYTLVYGSMPFQGGDYNRLVRNITSGDFIQPREQSGALSLIRYCLTPDASNRATTKDILRHDWLAHGPVLSLRLNSICKPIQPVASSSISLADPVSTTNEQDKVHYRSSITPAMHNDKSLSPSNSLVELELHTSSFFDTAKLRENHSTKTKDQQRRNRTSAVLPESTRYYQANHPKTNATTLPSHNAHRRPLSLSIDDQHSTSPIDYQLTSTSDKSSRISSPKSAATAPTYVRRTRRTISPATNHENDYDRYQTSINRYTLPASPETTRRTMSPNSPSRYVISYDFDKTLRDLKRKPVYKYIPQTSTNEYNIVPSLLSSTTPIAPSVFTTSAIKFAPVPTRRTSPLKDHETNIISSARLSNNPNTIPPNSPSTLDDSITKSAAYTNSTNRRSLLNSYDLPSSSPPPSTISNSRHNRLLDDNNNFISLKVHD